MPPAADTVRDLAHKHKQRAVIKRLDNFSPKLREAAKKAFATQLTEQERPLILYDRSFLGNGKAGVLLTDRAIYSSSPRSCVPLSSIRSVHVERASMSEQMAGNNTIQLLVNGEVFYSQIASVGSNSSFLTFLALVTDALRQSATGPAAGANASAPVAVSPSASNDPVPLAAGAICAGQSREQVARQLQAVGLSPAEGERIVDGMLAIVQAPQSGALMQRVGAGIVLTVIGLAAAIAAGVTRQSAFLIFAPQGIAAMGVVLVCSGIFRLLFGSPKLTARQLADAWRAQGG
jgi:hypothetical protein